MIAKVRRRPTALSMVSVMLEDPVQNKSWCGF
jgi:hypothetical protein